MAKADRQNAELAKIIVELESLLQSSLMIDSFIDPASLKMKPHYPAFAPPVILLTPLPQPTPQFPAEPTIVQKLIPGMKRKYKLDLRDAKARYEVERRMRDFGDKERVKILEQEKKRHAKLIDAHTREVEAQHSDVDRFTKDLELKYKNAIRKYCNMVINSSRYPKGFPQTAKIAFVSESRQLVIEYDLPDIEIIPPTLKYKYTKATDEMSISLRPVAQRKALYSSIVAQITLRTLHEIFQADRHKHIETIVFNGYVETVDKGTGRDVTVCLVTVRTSRDQFMKMDLHRVEPEACLKTLHATVSKNAAELAPVRPILEFNMVDPRFVEEADILSTLDQRPNLMELTPSEFESLITNLFEKMGLEAKQTQASRDGGVDCVAFDPRPIFGGKVVIQAKRYKHTVGVSAVRDLFGTLQNEGASKGILVTTSGYGKAGYEFAKGKPIELLSGSHLLHLLGEYAGIDAKIEAPLTWTDPKLDVQEV